MVFLSLPRAVVGTAGWLGGRRADGPSPLHPSFTIYHLSALLFGDIKQFPWEATRDPEALSWAVWGTKSPRVILQGLCQAFPTEGLLGKPEQPACGHGVWFLRSLTEAETLRRRGTGQAAHSQIWGPGQTLLFSLVTPTLSQGFLTGDPRNL